MRNSCLLRGCPSFTLNICNPPSSRLPASNVSLASPAMRLQSMRVLIIDDDEDLRNLLSRYIRAQWADAQIDSYDPLERDLPAADFPLSSYDVLVLDYMRSAISARVGG